MPAKFRIDPVRVRIQPVGLAVFASRHAPGFAMPWSAHPYAKLVLAGEGGGSLETGRGASPLTAGDVVLVPRGARHRFVDDTRRPLALLGLCVDEEALGTGPAAAAWRGVGQALGASRPRALDAWRRAQVERRLRLLLSAQADAGPGRDAALWSECLGLCADLVRGARPPRAAAPDADGFAAAIARCEERFREPLRVAELARLAGLSERGFLKRFAARFGCAPVRWLARRRVAHARALLATGTPVLDAALSAGYRDLSHFYRQFRREVGETPARWARGAR